MALLSIVIWFDDFLRVKVHMPVLFSDIFGILSSQEIYDISHLTIRHPTIDHLIAGVCVYQRCVNTGLSIKGIKWINADLTMTKV